MPFVCTRLFNNERYASSVALAILSIEEVGKYLIHRDNQAGGGEYTRQHSTKQRAVSAQYLADLRMSLSRHLPGDLKLKRLAELRSLGDIGEATPTRTEVSERLEEAFEEIVQQMASELITARYVISTGRGDTLKTKNRALYVDIGPSNGVRTDPSQFSRAEAEEWLRQVDRALVEIGYDE